MKSISVAVLLFGFFAPCLYSPISFAESRWDDTNWSEWARSNPDWVSGFPPFKVLGNIYYVGTEGIGAYLITSDEGHILLDGGMPQNAPLIVESIKSLGFSIKDVKYLINSHAHFDHSGGLNELKEISGAEMISSTEDKEWLESGLYPGNDNPAYKSLPVKVDATIKDGDTIGVGGVKLTANLTPGHTPGCTSWTTSVMENGEAFNVLMFCSATVAGNRLNPIPQYPGIIEDYRSTFEKIGKWKVDVYLSNHPFFFNLKSKRRAQLEGNKHAFINSEEFPLAVWRMKEAFEKNLRKQASDAVIEKN